MVIPLLSRFASIAKPRSNTVTDYNIESEQLSHEFPAEMTRSLFTEAKSDPTTDESMDR
jgi:hypothetical protein